MQYFLLRVGQTLIKLLFLLAQFQLGGIGQGSKHIFEGVGFVFLILSAELSVPGRSASEDVGMIGMRFN